MARSMDLLGLYINSGITASIRELAQLDQEWQAADADRKVAWERLRGTSYDGRSAEDFEAKMDNFMRLTKKITDHKRMHNI